MSPRQIGRENKPVTSAPKLAVEKPFKIFNHKRRRYIRLDVSSPLIFKVFQPAEPNLDLKNAETHSGMVLNISGGGVLMETDIRLNQGDYIIMEIVLEDVEKLSGVMGKIKRVDEEEVNQKILVGVEFMTTQQLQDELPSTLLKNFANQIFSFDEQIRKVLLKYVFAHKVDEV